MNIGKRDQQELFLKRKNQKINLTHFLYIPNARLRERVENKRRLGIK
jgi:hypothetical protein